MKKFSYSFLIIILVLVFYLSINYPNKLFISFDYLKDYLFYPVRAINEDDKLVVSDTMKDSIISSLKEDIYELQKLNNINISLSDFNYVNATIIERNREYWFNSFTINKGASSGIKLDMAVIDSDGLIGRISHVSNNISTVKLITTNDTKNKISAVIEEDNNKIYGIISGYNKNNNTLELIVTSDIEVKKDSLVKTTGMGGIFPSGILIGKVMDKIKKEDGITNVIRVIPAANIEGERYVSVLQRKEVSN